MEIRDPVHNFIDVNDTETAVINDPAFQRLRRIRQLAMADLVYPGAVHHRFEHSIGVCHVAGRVAERLLARREDQDQIAYVRMAALVHDIGHGPYSHVSEDPLAEVNKDWLIQSGIPKDKVHERIGLDILKHRLRGNNLINGATYRHVKSILDTIGNTTRTIQRDIVSGPLDADKMDYLLRDSLFCGVKYGVYDVERLIRALTVIRQGQDAFIGVKVEDVAVLDQYVIARYNMSLQVYGHKTRRATDLMLNRAIMAAVRAGDEYVVKAYTYEQDSKDFVERYLAFDDRVLMSYLLDSLSPIAKNLATRLVNRRLPTRVCYQPLHEITDDAMQERLRDKNQRQSATDEIRQEFEQNFSGADPDCVFVEVVDSKPVGKFNDLPEVDPEQIFLMSDTWNQPRTLPKESHFFRDYKFTPNPHLSVYVNLDEAEGETHESCRRRAWDILGHLFANGTEATNVKQ